MKEQFHARMLRIHFGESDKWQGKPLHEAIVAKSQELGHHAVAHLFASTRRSSAPRTPRREARSRPYSKFSRASTGS